MNRSLAFTALAAATLVVACDSSQSVTPPPTGPFTIAPLDPWAGSKVLIGSADFTDHGQGAFVVLGTDSLMLTRIDDTTMSAELPDAIGGTFTPRVVVEGLSFALQAITVSGYSSYHQYDPQLEWDIYVWPRTGPAAVMGGSATGLTFIDLDAGTVTTDDTILDLQYIRGPGATYRDSVFLLARAGSALESWRLLPAPTLIDTARLGGFAYYRQAMQLGPNTLWTGADNGWYIWTRADSTAPYAWTSNDVVSETEGVYISPRHDRATIQVDQATGGIPVFQAPSGALAYSVTQMVASQGVDFSSDGELLAMVGGVTAINGPGRVLLMRASTGEVLGDTTLSHSVFGAAIDPVRPLLYIGEELPNGRPSVLVLERSNFRLLGKLAAPESAPECSTFCYKGVLALSAANAIYAVAAFSTPGTQAYRFTLPAGSGVPAPSGGR